MQHHLPDALLAEHAAGTLTPAAEVLVAAHLTLCPACRARAEEIEAIAGAMLDTLPAAALDAGALDRALAQLNGATAGAGPPAPAAATDGLLLPRPLRRHVGGNVDTLRWRWLVPGIERARLDLEAGAGSCYLLRGQPGARLPRHTHDGTEMTLTLTGAYVDEQGRFGRGDVEISDDAVAHRLVVEPEEPCLCLVVLEGALRLTGQAARLLNPLLR